MPDGEQNAHEQYLKSIGLRSVYWILMPDGTRMFHSELESIAEYVAKLSPSERRGAIIFPGFTAD